MVDAYGLFVLQAISETPPSQSCQPLRIMLSSHNEHNFKILGCQTQKDLGGYQIQPSYFTDELTEL